MTRNTQRKIKISLLKAKFSDGWASLDLNDVYTNTVSGSNLEAQHDHFGHLVFLVLPAFIYRATEFPQGTARSFVD